MDKRQDIVAAARCWLGTPYVHQASAKGVGSDCLGLLRGVWREVMGQEPEQVPVYSMDWSEPQGEERMWVAARRHLVETVCEDLMAAQVLPNIWVSSPRPGRFQGSSTHIPVMGLWKTH